MRLPPPQVLLRGLAILEALNRRPVSSVDDIARATALPKPTVVRMLSLLASASYVQRLPRRRGYTLNDRVLALSAGYRSQDAVVRAARPILSGFTARHRWPVAIATLDGDAMRVRAGTESPFATPGDLALIAQRVPILTSAVGRAYLAFCPEEEREMIVALLKASARKHDLPARDQQFLSGLIGSIRRVGYAVSAPQPGDPAIGLAVPVRAKQRVLACLTLRYLGKAISEADVVHRYLSPLRAAASAIAHAVSRTSE